MLYSKLYYNYNVHADCGNHLYFLLIYMYSSRINLFKLGVEHKFN